MRQIILKIKFDFLMHFKSPSRETLQYRAYGLANAFGTKLSSHHVQMLCCNANDRSPALLKNYKQFMKRYLHHDYIFTTQNVNQQHNFTKR